MMNDGSMVCGIVVWMCPFVHLEIALYFSDRNNDCAIVLCPFTLYYGHNICVLWARNDIDKTRMTRMNEGICLLLMNLHGNVITCR